jgi:hypothetical protein
MCGRHMFGTLLLTSMLALAWSSLVISSSWSSSPDTDSIFDAKIGVLMKEGLRPSTLDDSESHRSRRTWDGDTLDFRTGGVAGRGSGEMRVEERYHVVL